MALRRGQRWISKPPPGPGIDPAHPLARGLVGCWLLNEGTGLLARNLAPNSVGGGGSGGAPATDGTLTGSASRAITRAGLAVATGSSGYVDCGTDLSHLANCSVGVMVVPPSSWAASTSYQIASKGYDATSTQWQLLITTNGSSVPTLQWQSYRTSTGYSGVAASTFVPQAGVPFRVLGTIAPTATGSVFNLYVNGLLDATATTTNALATTSRRLLLGAVDNAGSAAQFLGGSIVEAYHWSRALSPGEAAEFHANPYGMVQAPPAARLFIASSATLTPPGIGSGEAEGTHTASASPGIAPAGIGSGEVAGDPVAAAGAVPTGIGSAETPGTQSVGAAAGLAPPGISSGETPGTPTTLGLVAGAKQAMPLTGSVQVQVSTSLTTRISSVQQYQEPIGQNNAAFSLGATGLPATNMQYSEDITVPAGTVVSRDLTALPVQAPGVSAVFGHVMAVFAWNEAAVAGNDVFFDGGVNVWVAPFDLAQGSPPAAGTHIKRVAAGSIYNDGSPLAGYAVTSGSRMIYLANPGATAILVNLILIGSNP